MDINFESNQKFKPVILDITLLSKPAKLTVLYI